MVQLFRLNKDRIKLYLWISGVSLVIALLSEAFSSSDRLAARLVNHIWHLVFLGTIHYIFLEYALRYFKLSWRGVLTALVLIFIFMMMYSFGHQAWKRLGESILIYTPLDTYASWDEETQDLMAYSMGSLFFFGLIRHIFDYRNLRIKTQQLLIEKQTAELNYLKSQTNPHFLFNTLNNIYSLSRDKSDLAPESLMRLSKILRFMLYETSSDFISLEQEMKIIEDYISLEQLRYDDSLHINYNHDIEDKKQAIPPLLLIPLVENAFKHGASETRRNPFVDIHLSTRNRQLSLMVKNSVDDPAELKEVQENIGISNLRRQLDLLYSDYGLNLNQKDSIFTAILSINLASYVQH